MKKNMKKIITGILLGGILLLSACTGKAPQAPQLEESITISIGAEERAISMQELQKMHAVTREISGENGAGEKISFEATGVALDELCRAQKINAADFSSIVFTAKDGYEMKLGAEIFTEKEVVLTYQKDGEALAEKDQPLTVSIDGMPTKYFVSSIVNIRFEADAPADNSAK